MLLVDESDRGVLVRSAAPPGAHVQCAPSFFPGPWDAVVVPAALYFSSDLRKSRPAPVVLVYGPGHLFRAAWLAGVHDYLKEPWTADELFLRLRGPAPTVLEWTSLARSFRLESGVLWGEGSAELSPAEADILRLLVQRRGSPVSRAVLGWAAACDEGRVIDTLVGRLRRKLMLVGALGAIDAVRGVGYRLP